jgi:molybdenum cofactor synthesis domain-containing protein
MAPTSVRRAAVVTVSTGVSRGEREDRSGAILREGLRAMGFEVLPPCVVPDGFEPLAGELVRLADVERVDLLLTTGGTGLTPDDLTPEATRTLISREVPGIAEELRRAGSLATRTALLSRGVAGMRGRTLVVNLPGSPAAVREGLAVLAPLLDHVFELVAGGHRHPERTEGPTPCG